MNPIATYSFLPWLRQGIANTITSADHDAGVKTRASVHVELQLSGDPVGGGAELTQTVARDIALYGPGDIVGIDQRAVVRTEPRDWITNFESNYLPAVDFYDEDLPWRYTPAAPDSTRLRPWIALIVLEEGEFDEGKNAANRPLPSISIGDPSVLPNADELWAWAHVHFNEPLWGAPGELVSADMNQVLPRVQSILASNPDSAYARLLSPRRLKDNTPYHAFVVPTFETGRLAGLGQDITTAPNATHSAWATYGGRPEPTSYPIYFRWFFRTGSRGDFEYLVNLLKPQPVDKRVGTRDMDVQDPGSNIPGILDPALGGILRLGGALRVPDADLGPADLAERQKYENWDKPYPDLFQHALAAFVNLPDDYSALAAAAANAASGLAPGISDDPDPLITAPLYGRWHALTQRLLTNRDGTPAPNPSNWVHRLNLDPRFRVPAGFGTDVVETNAEEYMDDAWQQIGDVLAANQKIRRLHLATDVSLRWFDRHLTPLAVTNPERAFALTSPVAPRISVSPAALATILDAPAAELPLSLSNGATVESARRASVVLPALTSTAMRRVVRPQARLMRLLPFDTAITADNLLGRVNAGDVSAAPPKTVPPDIPTVNEVAGAAEPEGAPGWVLTLLSRFSWLPLALLALGVVILILLLLAASLAIGLIVGLVALAVLGAVSLVLRRWAVAHARAQSLTEAGQAPGQVDKLPKSPDFVLSDPGSAVRPTTGTTDSPTAVRFKSALRDSFSLVSASTAVSERPAPSPVKLASLTTLMVSSLNPALTIPRRGFSTIAIPPWLVALNGDEFGEVMAYPKIDLPMYEPLKAISVELFLPNINLIAQNSITLIETNQRFIESYLVGLNHEFARKLLWREYPTDQRGSYFRQFWDVRSVMNSEGLSENALKEQLYDIPELHRWPPASNLGDHNQRASSDEKGEEAVLVIRGELLKKYPTAVIYAHRAQWAMDGGAIDLTEPRSLVELTADEEQNPPRTKVRTPLYEAKADPDIYFFGFDLTIADAKGGTGEHPGDDPGWFFVIKERPGEPRFGLELDRTRPLEVATELIWDDAMPGGVPGQFLSATSLAAVPLVAPPGPPNDPEGKTPQYEDDEKAIAAPVSSARWAYLLFREPVMVAVHADEMLGSGS